MKRTAYLAGTVYGLLAVALGAFGAHALEDLLTTNGHAAVYDTASHYQIIHAVLLVIMGLVAERGESKWLRAGIIACSVGILVFSGSLYVLSIFDIPIMGAITPIGGIGMLIGWASLFFHFYSTTKSTTP